MKKKNKLLTLFSHIQQFQHGSRFLLSISWCLRSTKLEFMPHFGLMIFSADQIRDPFFGQIRATIHNV